MGLKMLYLKSLTDRQNIIDFKYGFVKDGGHFRSQAGSTHFYTQVTVLHNEVHLASKVVRAFLQERRVST